MTSVPFVSRRLYACSVMMAWLACGALSGCSDTTDEGPGLDASPRPDAGGSQDSSAEVADTAADENHDASLPSDATAEGRSPDSSGPDARQDAPWDGSSQEGSDGRQDAPTSESGDGATCTQDPVWTSASLSLTFTRSGGFVAPPPPDAGCSGINVRYELLTPDRTLAQRGCLFTGPVNRMIHLTQAQFDAIMANVGSIRTTCTKLCGADLPDMVLTVSASGVRNTYNSNFTAGCPGVPLLPPFVEHGQLGALGSLLDATAAAACAPDAGSGDAGASDSSTDDAGSCLPLPSDDGGFADAAEGG